MLASFTLTALVGARPPAVDELVGAVLILLAILILSPAHHALEAVTAWRRAQRPMVPAHAPSTPLERKGEWS